MTDTSNPRTPHPAGAETLNPPRAPDPPAGPPRAGRPPGPPRGRRRGRPRGPALLAVLAALLAGALAGCGTVSGELPPAADQPWEPLATVVPATLRYEDDIPQVPKDLVPPAIPLPEPGQFAPGGALARIHERGYLRVGVSRDTQLRGAWNPVEGRFEGFDVDLARRIAMALFGVPDEAAADQYIRYFPVSYSERIPALLPRRGAGSGDAPAAGDTPSENTPSGDTLVDIVVSTMTYTPHRARKVGLSAAYFTAYPRFLSRREPAAPDTAEPAGAAAPKPDQGDGPGIDSAAELAGRKVCAPRATTSLNNLERLYREQGGSFEIVGHLNELSDCLLAFQQGTVDVVAANDASLVGMLAQDSTAVLGSYRTAGPPEYYSVAFQRENRELAAFVNGVVESLRRDRAAWFALCRKWEVKEMPCEQSQPPEPIWADE